MNDYSIVHVSRTAILTSGLEWAEYHRTHFATLQNLLASSKWWRQVAYLCSSTCHSTCCRGAAAADGSALTLVFWEDHINRSFLLHCSKCDFIETYNCSITEFSNFRTFFKKSSKHFLCSPFRRGKTAEPDLVKKMLELQLSPLN